MLGQMWRSSSSPFLSPATENGWHGYPHVRISWLGTSLSGSFANSFTSLAIGTLLKFFASILRHHSSVSQNMMVLDSSAQENPKLNPPIPEHKSTCLSLFIIHPHIYVKITTEHVCLVTIKPSAILNLIAKLFIDLF